MATGDLRGNLERLRMQLLSINYPYPFDTQGLKQGIPAVVLPLLHHALLGYSRHVARYLSASGYELYAKSDLRFMESALRFFRQEFNYRCALTIAQIFSRGYAERKMIFIHDAIQMSKRKHNELVKLGREKTIDKVQFVDHLPSRKLKSLEHTLKSSKSSLRCFKDPGCGHVDIPVLPISETTSPRSRNIDNNAEVHHYGVSKGKRSNIQSSESSNDTRVKNLSPKVKKHVTYQADFTDLGPAASDELSPGDHSHQEICQRIMNTAEKLEARFSTLEAGVTRAKETLQDKLVSLEERVRNLEASKSEQKMANFKDVSRRSCKEQSTAYTTGDLSQHKSLAYASSCTTTEPMKHDTYEQSQLSTCIPMDMLRPKCNEHAKSLNGDFQDKRHFEAVTGVPTPQPPNSQAIRDISNTHQYVVKSLTDQVVGTSQVKVCEKGYPSDSFIQEPFTSTRDFIAGIRARFNRTLELLSQEAHITPSPAAPSC